MIKTIFAWDLGATKCTAGIVEFNSETLALVCKKHFTVKLTEASSLETLINKIETGLDYGMSDAGAICIGAAGHYNGEYLLLENAYPYPMPFANIAKEQAWPAYAIVHDYAPIVCATFTSYMDQPRNIKHLNTSPLNAQGRRVALGIGTGLGLKDGVLFSDGEFWLGSNEIGHIGVTMPPLAETAHLQRHEALQDFLKTKAQQETNPALTFEKILSGSGTVRLYQFFYTDGANISPEEVGFKMREGLVPELLDTFAWYAGLLVGTVQLSFMPTGGIWITGGVALKNLHVFDRPDFFAGIYASPAYRAQRETYPLGILCNHEHALIGCGYYASKRLLNKTSNVLRLTG